MHHTTAVGLAGQVPSAPKRPQLSNSSWEAKPRTKAQAAVGRPLTQLLHRHRLLHGGWQHLALAGDCAGGRRLARRLCCHHRHLRWLWCWARGLRSCWRRLLGLLCWCCFRCLLLWGRSMLGVLSRLGLLMSLLLLLLFLLLHLLMPLLEPGLGCDGRGGCSCRLGCSAFAPASVTTRLQAHSMYHRSQLSGMQAMACRG